MNIDHKLYQSIVFAFLFSATITMFSSCKKQKTEDQGPKSNTPLTTYTVTGKINTCSGPAGVGCKIGNIVYKSDGSFILTYTHQQNSSPLTLSRTTTNFKGEPVTRNLPPVPVNQNYDVGSFILRPASSFYVRFKSSSVVTYTDGITFGYFYNPSGQMLPLVFSANFTDTTLLFTYNINGTIYSNMQGYDYSQIGGPDEDANIPTHLISFWCSYKNVSYSDQKMMLKCNTGNPTDTILINLP